MNNVGIQVVLNAQTAQATNNVNSFTNSVNAMGSAAGAAARNVNRNLTPALNSVTRPAVNANGALSGFNNIIRDAPYGIIGIGNNITQLTDAFGQLRRSTGSVAGALSALIGGVFSPAGLLTIGLSSAISLWTVYAQRQQKAASEAKKAAAELKYLGEILKDTKNSLEQYQASAVGEVARLRELYAVATDEVRSRRDRVSALQLLKEATNGYLDKLTLETVRTDAARAALDKFNESLFNNALAKAYQGQIEAMAKSYADFKDRADAGRKAIEAIDAAQAKRNLNPLQAALDIQQIGAKNEQRRADLVKQTNSFIKQQNALYDQIVSKGTQLADIQVKAQPFAKGGAEKLTAYGKIWKDLKNNLLAIQAESELLNLPLDAINNRKIDVMSLALQELARISKGEVTPEMKDLKDQIDLLTASVLGSKTITSSFALSLSKPVLTINPFNKDEIESKLATSFNDTSASLDLKITPPLVVDFSAPLNKSFTQAQADFNAGLAKFVPRVTKATSDALVQMNAAIQALPADAISSLAEGVGKALVSGNIGDVLGGFVNTISSFLAQMGKLLIVQGLAIEAFKTSLSSLQGAGAIIAGAALIAASAAFQAFASKGLNSYATGGIVTSPQLALVGDNPGRKEAIIPSEMWDKLGAGSDLAVTTKVSGSDLLLVVQRANREFKRFN